LQPWLWLHVQDRKVSKAQPDRKVLLDPLDLPGLQVPKALKVQKDLKVQPLRWAT
jgi:hypothetical protein